MPLVRGRSFGVRLGTPALCHRSKWSAAGNKRTADKASHVSEPIYNKKRGQRTEQTHKWLPADCKMMWQSSINVHRWARENNIAKRMLTSDENKTRTRTRTLLVKMSCQASSPSSTTSCCTLICRKSHYANGVTARYVVDLCNRFCL